MASLNRPAGFTSLRMGGKVGPKAVDFMIRSDRQCRGGSGESPRRSHWGDSGDAIYPV